MARYTVQQIMQESPVIPVIVLDRVDDAIPLAQALIAGGIKVLEVTLRTEAALAAVKAIADNVPDAIVGVGTATSIEHIHAAVEHGAEFVISPGITDKLLTSAESVDVPFLPGIATVSELMLGMEAGLNHFKFFPASAAGGVPVLKAFAGPFADVRFCPTGGISEKNFLEFLALKNVLCVGGSWVAPSKLIDAGAWQTITDLAQQAVQTIHNK